MTTPELRYDPNCLRWVWESVEERLRQQLSAAQARERVLRQLNDALESLLVCYRTGRRPSDSMLDKIAKLKQEAAEGG